MKSTTAVKDLVCGMEIEPAAAAGRTEHNGQAITSAGPSARRSSIFIRSNTWAGLRERRRAARAAAVKSNKCTVT